MRGVVGQGVAETTVGAQMREECVGFVEGLERVVADHVVLPFVGWCWYNVYNVGAMSTLGVIEFPYGDAVSDSQSLSSVSATGIDDEQQAFIDLISCGQTVERALSLRGITEYRYAKWRSELPAFEQALRIARAMVIDRRIDRMHETAKDEPDVNRARLMIDTDKWLASKLIPKVYGDKLDITIEARVSIRGAIERARLRGQLRPTCDSADIIDVQVIDSQAQDDRGQIDNESTPPLPDIFD